MQRNKCMLVHGLSKDEINSLRLLGNVKEITPEKVTLKIKHIANDEYEEEDLIIEEVPNEKAILFNDFSDAEVQAIIKKVRNAVKGGVLAVVTPLSNNWSFKYLINHLIEEREMYLKGQKGR